MNASMIMWRMKRREIIQRVRCLWSDRSKGRAAGKFRIGLLWKMRMLISDLGWGSREKSRMELLVASNGVIGAVQPSWLGCWVYRSQSPPGAHSSVHIASMILIMTIITIRYLFKMAAIDTVNKTKEQKNLVNCKCGEGASLLNSATFNLSPMDGTCDRFCCLTNQFNASSLVGFGDRFEFARNSSWHSEGSRVTLTGWPPRSNNAIQQN